MDRTAAFSLSAFATGIFAAPAFATTIDPDVTVLNVDYTAASPSVTIDIVGDSAPEYGFVLDGDPARPKLETYSFALVGQQSDMPYYPTDRDSMSPIFNFTDVGDGYYGLNFTGDHVGGTGPYYTGWALVDGDGMHISQIGYKLAPSAVPLPAAGTLSLLGVGAGALMRRRQLQRQRAAA